MDFKSRGYRDERLGSAVGTLPAGVEVTVREAHDRKLLFVLNTEDDAVEISSLPSVVDLLTGEGVEGSLRSARMSAQSFVSVIRFKLIGPPAVAHLFQRAGNRGVGMRPGVAYCDRLPLDPTSPSIEYPPIAQAGLMRGTAPNNRVMAFHVPGHPVVHLKPPRSI